MKPAAGKSRIQNTVSKNSFKSKKPLKCKTLLENLKSSNLILQSSTTQKMVETAYVVTSEDKRFSILYTFLKRRSQEKTIVVFNSQAAVNFYEEVLSHIDHRIPLMALHESQTKKEQQVVLNRFNKKDHIALLCTEEIVSSCNLGPIDCMIQYDPPLNVKGYVERLRNWSHGPTGRSLLIITEQEIPFIHHLKSQLVDIHPLDVAWGKVINIQSKLEKLINEKYFAYIGALQSFTTYVKSYNTHPNKELFDISTLDLSLTAKNFGFEVVPFVDLDNTKTVTETQEKDEVKDEMRDKKKDRKRRTPKLKKKYRLIR